MRVPPWPKLAWHVAFNQLEVIRQAGADLSILVDQTGL